MRTAAGVLTIAAVAATAAGTVFAAAVEDDLAVVKRAVARQEVAPRTPPAVAPADEPEAADIEIDRDAARRPRAARPGREPQWLKVRVTEKGSKKARVTVNLPIALVRALGDDFPIDFTPRRGWRGDGRRVVRVGEVLAALEAGQALVEIDDEEATVRVWVE